VATPKSSSSLSGGAIAGIVIGALAGVALIAAAAFLILRTRRRKSLDLPVHTAKSEKKADDGAVLLGSLPQQSANLRPAENSLVPFGLSWKPNEDLSPQHRGPAHGTVGIPSIRSVRRCHSLRSPYSYSYSYFYSYSYCYCYIYFLWRDTARQSVLRGAAFDLPMIVWGSGVLWQFSTLGPQQEKVRVAYSLAVWRDTARLIGRSGTAFDLPMNVRESGVLSHSAPRTQQKNARAKPNMQFRELGICSVCFIYLAIKLLISLCYPGRTSCLADVIIRLTPPGDSVGSASVYSVAILLS
jgi:hypothetical protein